MPMKNFKIIDNVGTSKRIKELLKKQGLRPKDVQEALKLESVQSVYKWINQDCKTIPSLDKLVNLADLLDVQMEEILILQEMKKE